MFWDGEVIEKMAQHRDEWEVTKCLTLRDYRNWLLLYTDLSNKES
jgi:hypothetical protein